MNRISRPRLTNGFSFIELLVAITLIVVVSVMSYRILNSVLDNREHLEQVRTEQRNLMLAFVRLEEDLAQVRARAVRSIDGTELASFTGRRTDTRAVSEPALEFTRGGVPILNNLPQSDLQRVGYRLNDEGVLFRIVWPVLDRAPTTSPIESPILENIDEMRARFLNSDGQWVDVWPPENTGRPLDSKSDSTHLLPKGLELLVKLKTGQEIKRLFLISSS